MKGKSQLSPASAAVLADIAWSLRAQVLITEHPAAREALLVTAAKVQLAFERHFRRAEVREVWEAANRDASVELGRIP